MKKIIWIIVILVFFAFAVKTFWNLQLAPVSADNQTRSTIIGKGESVDEIANQLKKDGLIRSPLFFKIYLKQNNLADKIQSGTFRLSPSMPVAEIARKLTTTPQDIWITFLEGWRVEEMAEKLNEDLGIKNNDFLKYAREGYLFPDTYLFPREVTAQTVVKKLEDTFDQKYTDDLRVKIKAQGLTEAQGVILASIVEREARSDAVRTQVASILLKRLKIGMGLDVDSTIQYALGYQLTEKSWWKRHLSKNDLKVDSPYNTYLHAGLPPAPICNPSLSSLKAVANADASTPYLYYYHDSQGNSYYAKTLEEHNANVANHP